MRSLMFALVLAAAVGAACSGAPVAPTATSTAPPSPTPEAQQVMLWTQPPPGPNEACMGALAIGVLVTDERSGLGFAGDDGDPTPVMWPNGWTAWRVDGKVTLVDRQGRVVAREGDRIEMGGGFLPQGAWSTCGDLTVTGAAPAP
jgi:hypothetical protein